MPIETGMQYEAYTMVNEANTALAVGSGAVEVFATPMMIALMEQAASACAMPGLAEGQVTVGAEIQVAHTAATPIGMRVRAVAAVTAVCARQIDFALAAYDECGEIGSGTHTRFIVDKDKFMQKAQEKAGLPAK